MQNTLQELEILRQDDIIRQDQIRTLWLMLGDLKKELQPQIKRINNQLIRSKELLLVFEYLDIGQIYRCRLVCRRFNLLYIKYKDRLQVRISKEILSKTDELQKLSEPSQQLLMIVIKLNYYSQVWKDLLQGKLLFKENKIYTKQVPLTIHIDWLTKVGSVQQIKECIQILNGAQKMKKTNQQSLMANYFSQLKLVVEHAEFPEYLKQQQNGCQIERLKQLIKY